MSSSYYKEGAWWVSPYNMEPEVRKASLPPESVEIHDATLRDGEQTPGVVFTSDDKLRIAEKLVEAGVTRIECGMPAVSQSDREAILKITKAFPEARTFAFTRANKNDIDMARDCGVTGVVIEVPLGYPKLKYQFQWSWEKVLEKSIESINYARSQGLWTVYFPYDTTRARLEDIENVIGGIMQNAQPNAIGVVDTMGCALPQTIQYLVRLVKKLSGGLPVEVHTHNDYGLAVATELAGIAAGANVLHCCVNGLGERTGNAPLEELILNMVILLGMDTPYKLDKLGALCKLVEELSGLPAAPNKPFGGSRNYTRESGIGIDMVVKHPLAMFSTDPAYFGRKGDVVLGKKSGKASVAYCLEQLGITAADDQIMAILEQVKALGEKKKGILTGQEFREIVDHIL